MVQCGSEKANELRSVFAQNPSRYDGYKIKKVDDKVLSRDGLSSGGAR